MPNNHCHPDQSHPDQDIDIFFVIEVEFEVGLVFKGHISHHPSPILSFSLCSAQHVWSMPVQVCLGQWQDKSLPVPVVRFYDPRAFFHVQVLLLDHGQSPHSSSLMQGYNATVLAYGQTGSGKTHTMSGGTGIHGLPEEGGKHTCLIFSLKHFSCQTTQVMVLICKPVIPQCSKYTFHSVQSIGIRVRAGC